MHKSFLALAAGVAFLGLAAFGPAKAADQSTIDVNLAATITAENVAATLTQNANATNKVNGAIRGAKADVSATAANIANDVDATNTAAALTATPVYGGAGAIVADVQNIGAPVGQAATASITSGAVRDATSAAQAVNIGNVTTSVNLVK